MAVAHKLAALLALIACTVTTTSALSTKYNPNNNYQRPEIQPNVGYHQQLLPQLSSPPASSSYIVDPAFDTYQAPALNLQLPKVAAAAAFYVPEPSAELKAPLQYFPQQQQQQNLDLNNYYPPGGLSQDLKAPAIGSQWNPNNDPKFFYEVPAIISKQELPTNAYPKKYNKDIHTKVKPYSYRPKQEIVLEPVNKNSFALKQKNLVKANANLAKKDNQKSIYNGGVTGTRQKVVQPKFSAPKLNQYNDEQPESELLAATGFTGGFDTEGVEHGSGAEKYSQGLSADITASLGLTSPHAPSKGERLEFHMTGHDGPHSYKWGFDTGKGHNRQFRFEEKDKEGLVKGHFGFYDKHGKLQMINYDAHPEDGYHAESSNNFEKKY